MAWESQDILKIACTDSQALRRETTDSRKPSLRLLVEIYHVFVYPLCYPGLVQLVAEIADARLHFDQVTAVRLGVAIALQVFLAHQDRRQAASNAARRSVSTASCSRLSASRACGSAGSPAARCRSTRPAFPPGGAPTRPRAALPRGFPPQSRLGRLCTLPRSLSSGGSATGAGRHGRGGQGQRQPLDVEAHGYDLLRPGQHRRPMRVFKRDGGRRSSFKLA